MPRRKRSSSRAAVTPGPRTPAPSAAAAANVTEVPHLRCPACGMWAREEAAFRPRGSYGIEGAPYPLQARVQRYFYGGPGNIAWGPAADATAAQVDLVRGALERALTMLGAGVNAEGAAPQPGRRGASSPQTPSPAEAQAMQGLEAIKVRTHGWERRRPAQLLRLLEQWESNAPDQHLARDAVSKVLDLLSGYQSLEPDEFRDRAAYREAQTAQWSAILDALDDAQSR